MYKKTKALLSLLLIMAIVIVGCSNEKPSQGGQETNVAPEDKKVTLRLLHSFTGSQPQAPVYEPAIEKFSADHPNVTLKVEAAAGNSIREKLLAEMAANNAPDVFMHWGIRRVENYLKEDRVADLTELIKNDPDLSDMYVEDAYNSAIYKGGTYGLPIQTYMYYLVINKEIFEKHNVKVPETYDELVTAVKTFKEANLIPIAANNHSARYMMLTWLSQYKSLDSMITNTTGKEAFGEELLQAAEKAVELQKLGAFPEGKETLPTAQSLELFNAERSPMFYQHSWTIPSIKPELMDKLAVIPFPLADSDAQDTVLSGSGYFVYMSKDAYEDPDRREAAWELMKMLAGVDLGKQLIEQGIDIASINTEFDLSQTNPVFKQAIELRQQVQNIIPSLDEQLLSQNVSDEYWTLTDRLSLEDITPEQYVEELNKLIEQYPNTQFE